MATAWSHQRGERQSGSIGTRRCSSRQVQEPQRLDAASYPSLDQQRVHSRLPSTAERQAITTRVAGVSTFGSLPGCLECIGQAATTVDTVVEEGKCEFH